MGMLIGKTHSGSGNRRRYMAVVKDGVVEKNGGKSPGTTMKASTMTFMLNVTSENMVKYPKGE